MRIIDSRALLGGVALLLAGLLLSIIGLLFVTTGKSGEHVFHIRWIWEVMMNLQMLALGLMWFCYAERIQDAEPDAASKLRKHRLVSLFSVLAPVNFMILCIVNGWITDIPSRENMDKMCLLMLVIWFSLSIFRPFIKMKQKRVQPKAYVKLLYGPSKLAWTVGIVLSTCVFAASYSITQGGSYYIWLPFCIYVHAAMPYFYSAIDCQNRCYQPA